jgi:hypothetical protein
MDEQQQERLRALWKSGRDKYRSFFAVLEQVRHEIGNDALPKYCVEELGIGLSVITLATNILNGIDAKIAKSELVTANALEKERRAMVRSELAAANKIAKEQRATIKSRKETPHQSQAPVGTAIPTATNRSLDAIANEILKHERNAVASVIAIGGLLVEAAAQCEHGEYMEWLTKHFAWSHQSSLRYRRLFQLTQNQHSVDFEALNISLSALYFAADVSQSVLPQKNEALAAIIEAATKQRVSRAVAGDIFNSIVNPPGPEKPETIDDDDDSTIIADEEEGDEDVTDVSGDVTSSADERLRPLLFQSALQIMIATHANSPDDDWLKEIEANGRVAFYQLCDHMNALRSKVEAITGPLKSKADRAEAKAKNGKH